MFDESKLNYVTKIVTHHIWVMLLYFVYLINSNTSGS